MTAQVDLLVIGAGPAGLTAATELRTRTGARVVVVEREAEAGGVPRHCWHLGFGMRDLHTAVSGPTYARRLVDRAVSAGVEIRTRTMVTSWDPATGARCTSPRGIEQISGLATLLATGARERARPARMIPGDRPSGVYTTGELQNAVHLHDRQVGSRAVVVGGELVSWSAVMTLRDGGCHDVTLVTEHARPESYGLVNLFGRLALRTPVRTGVEVTRVIGHRRLTGVEVTDIRSGARSVLECDTVVFTGDWNPDSELARSAGMDLDAGTRGPLVDPLGRTSLPGVFAAGNSVHPVDTADVAALGGGHAAAGVARYLRDPAAPGWGAGVRVQAVPPLEWVSPGWYQPMLYPSRHRILAWTAEQVRFPWVVAHQDGLMLRRMRLPWPASPGRVLRIPWSLLAHADPRGGPITVGL